MSNHNSNKNRAETFFERCKRVLKQYTYKEIIFLSIKEIYEKIPKVKRNLRNRFYQKLDNMNPSIFYESDLNKDIAYLVMPKVAYSSIITAVCCKEKKQSNSLEPLSGYDNYLIRFEETEKLRTKSFRFTFVRNPFSRLVSCYKNRIATDKLTYKMMNMECQYISFDSTYSFEKFVNALDPLVILQNWHFSPQVKNVFLNKRLIVDFIGRFENLQEDYTMIAKRYGTKPLEHLNKSNYKSKAWQDYYNLETALKVYQLYQEDFDTWYPKAYEELIDYLKIK